LHFFGGLKAAIATRTFELEVAHPNSSGFWCVPLCFACANGRLRVPLAGPALAQLPAAHPNTNMNNDRQRLSFIIKHGVQ
jgi:hypothetical protein